MLLEERVGQPTTEAEAERFALELFGLHTTAKSLPGEYDDNFHLKIKPADAASLKAGSVAVAASASAEPIAHTPLSEISSSQLPLPENGNHAVSESDSAAQSAAPPSQPPVGTDFVLKIMHPARDSALIDLQCRALQHLAERAPQLTLPRVCLANTGEAFTTITAADGAPRLVWLLTYVPGTVMAKANPHSAEMLRSLGEMLGEVSTGLARFSHPAAQRELKWDFARAGWIREHLDRIADPDRRALLEKFIALYDAEIVPAMSRLRRSVVYGDANDYNVLVSDASTTLVAPSASSTSATCTNPYHL